MIVQKAKSKFAAPLLAEHCHSHQAICASRCSACGMRGAVWIYAMSDQQRPDLSWMTLPGRRGLFASAAALVLRRAAADYTCVIQQGNALIDLGDSL